MLPHIGQGRKAKIVMLITGFFFFLMAGQFLGGANFCLPEAGANVLFVFFSLATEG